MHRRNAATESKTDIVHFRNDGDVATTSKACDRLVGRRAEMTR